jgi:hypothetical protein
MRIASQIHDGSVAIINLNIPIPGMFHFSHISSGPIPIRNGQTSILTVHALSENVWHEIHFLPLIPRTNSR